MLLIQRLLALLITLYRRWLSGRGPLRDVRCSFAPEESCSAYGLRVACTAPSARVAIARIARRLRRCRDAWLVSDGATLGWRPVHDRSPREISMHMLADEERAPAIERMLHTRRMVARWRGESDARPAAHLQPLVASHAAIVRRATRRIAAFIGIATVATFAMLALPWIGGVALGVASLGALASTRTALVNDRRVARQALTSPAGWRA